MTLDDELLDPFQAAVRIVRAAFREAQLRVAAWDLRPVPDWYRRHEHDRT
jgi:hypothetical protein